MSTQEQRDELRRKIEESERRNEERNIADIAREATDNATEFVKTHPMLTVGAVALIGLVIGSRTSKGRELTGRAVGFADHLADLGMAYAGGMASRLGDATRHGGDRLVDFGDDVAFGGRAAKLFRRASEGRCAPRRPSCRPQGEPGLSRSQGLLAALIACIRNMQGRGLA